MEKRFRKNLELLLGIINQNINDYNHSIIILWNGISSKIKIYRLGNLLRKFIVNFSAS